MRSPAKSDLSSQSWATHESSMDGSHFSDEMSDEVTIEQQRKEELAAMAPPSDGSVISGNSRRTEQWVDEICRERANEAEEEWPNSNVTNEPVAVEGCSRARAKKRIRACKSLCTKTSPMWKTLIIRDHKDRDLLEGSLEFVPTENTRGCDRP